MSSSIRLNSEIITARRVRTMKKAITQDDLIFDNIKLMVEERKRHEKAAKDGGMLLPDNEGLFGKAIKDVYGKIKDKIMSGEFYDLIKIPAPACIHHPTTHL